MLNVFEICKSFPQKKGAVLSDISFSINKGEAVALVGENGAGKTTLIRILSLILNPDKGFISLNNIKFNEDPGYIKSKTGTLFSGDGSLYDRLSAKENIVYYARLNGVHKHEYNKMLEMLTGELSISNFLDDKVSTFSRGMKQRTAIVRTLITDPEFIMLDEPSTGLDIIASNSVKKIITRLKDSGKTVLFSSHNIDEIFSCADRILIIHKGKINCDKTVKSFKSKHGKDLTSYIKE
ncbi:MAG: ATP-binding cassette domain-containing protein [Spirochaetes bacterium]|jgi:sodium transport system ATP-binding protein|nr:ATP-binding cassette domain-containing protein [Spirochaetota bacterium]